MLDLGWQELFIIALVALIVVGPKDLPILVRSIAKWLRSMRKIVWTFQASIEEVGREAELNEIRDEAAYLLEELNEDVITGTTKINTEEKTSFGTDK
jgi:sec-independent protein translocase protein TatB